MSAGTWQTPSRMPSRAEMRPLPADLAALVRSGHLTEVEPGVYRRAPRSPPTEGAAMKPQLPPITRQGVTHDY